MFLIFAFIGLFVLSAVAEGQCPENSIGLKLNSSICYSFHPSLSQYVIAERECNLFGATVISIKNEFTNVYVAQLANLFFEHLEVGEIWTSGHRLINDKTYQWVDGDQIEDTKLSLSKKSDECVAINLKKGFWKSEDCYLQLPFVCEFVGKEVQNVPPTALILKDFMIGKQPFQYVLDFMPPDVTTVITTMAPTTTPKPKVCPDSWSYNNATGFCYGVFEEMNWGDAEAKCIKNGAHLASVHSQEEAVYVAALSKRVFTDLFHNWKAQSWIGLYTTDSNAHWQWTDGSAVDYIKWISTDPNIPGFENCVQVFSGESAAFTKKFNISLGDFSNYRCQEVLRSFICKKLPQ